MDAEQAPSFAYRPDGSPEAQSLDGLDLDKASMTEEPAVAVAGACVGGRNEAAAERSLVGSCVVDIRKDEERGLKLVYRTRT